MSKSRHKIDDILNDRLSEFRADTGPSDWAAVESGLRRRQRFREFAIRRNYLLSVLTLFIGIGIGAGTRSYFFTDETSERDQRITRETTNTGKGKDMIASSRELLHPRPHSSRRGEPTVADNNRTKNSVSIIANNADLRVTPPLSSGRGERGEVAQSSTSGNDFDFQPGNRGMRQPGMYARHSHAGFASGTGSLGGPAAAGRGMNPSTPNQTTQPDLSADITNRTSAPPAILNSMGRIPTETSLAGMNRSLSRSVPRHSRRSGSGPALYRMAGPITLKIGGGYSFSRQSVNSAIPDSVIAHPEYAAMRRKYETNGNSWQFGTELSWHPGRHLGFGIGLGVQHIERQASFTHISRYTAVYDSSGHNLKGYTETEKPTDTLKCRYDQQFTWLSIPLNLQYSIPLGRKVELEANAGFTLNYLLMAKGSEPDLQLTTSSKLPDLKGFNASLQLGGTAYYMVSRSSRIFLNASCQLFSAQPKSLTGITQRFTTIPVNVGYQFRF